VHGRKQGVAGIWKHRYGQDLENERNREKPCRANPQCKQSVNAAAREDYGDQDKSGRYEQKHVPPGDRLCKNRRRRGPSLLDTPGIKGKSLPRSGMHLPPCGFDPSPGPKGGSSLLRARSSKGLGSGAHAKEIRVKVRAFRVAMVLSSIAMLLEVLGAGKKWG